MLRSFLLENLIWNKFLRVKFLTQKGYESDRSREEGITLETLASEFLFYGENLNLITLSHDKFLFHLPVNAATQFL